MIDWTSLSDAVAFLSSDISPWVVVVPGLLIGLIFGAIPGIQISMAMAIFLPMTLYMDFIQAMLFLLAMFTGGGYGAAIPAILMNIPGTSGAIATTFDGYPMCRRGEHNEALGMALAASCVGSFGGYVILLFMIGPLSSAVLRVGPLELTIIVLWGITLIAALSNGSMVKGVVSGLLGLLAGTIGYSEAGVTRGTMGSDYLLDGIPVIPAMIGMFAASEMFSLINKKYLVEEGSSRAISPRSIMKGFLFAFRRPWIIMRGSVIGTGIGTVPGVGSFVASLLSYMSTKKSSKDPESFGKGNPDGVIAAEAANATSEAGSLATLLALGIPGGAATAVMLAALAMHNITGGPQFIREETEVVYAIILANLGQAILLLPLGLLVIPLLANVIKVPMTYLVPSVLAISVFGSFGLTGDLSGPFTVMVFAIIGWLLKKYNYSIPAAVIGILLGGLGEELFIYTYQISGGQVSYILERPLGIAMLLILLMSLFGRPLINMLLRSRIG